MARKKMWFGVPGGNMQWVPAPSAGMSREEIRYTNSLDLMNGRKAFKRSNSARARFEMDFPPQPSGGLDGLDVFSKFASGFYGQGISGGKVYFSDPYAENNLFPPEWATPGLWGAGWPAIGTNPDWVGASTTGLFGNPKAQCAYAVQPGVNPPIRCIIPIPPGFVLLWGASGPQGQSSAGAVIRARPVKANGNLGTGRMMRASDLLDPAQANRTNGYAGGTPDPNADLYGDGVNCVAAVFDLYSESGVRNIVIASMFARLVPLAPSGGAWPAIPPIQGDHQHGQGHHGLQFTDDAMPYTYDYITGRIKGLSTALEEVL